MIIPDQIEITALGVNRDEMLKDADKQAEAFFNGHPHRRVTAQSKVSERLMEGSAVLFEGTVHYESVF